MKTFGSNAVAVSLGGSAGELASLADCALALGGDFGVIDRWRGCSGPPPHQASRRARRKNASRSGPLDRPIPPSQHRPRHCHVHARRRLEIAGKLTVKEIKLATSYGTLTIPTDKIKASCRVF